VRRNTTDWEDPAVYRWDAYEEHLRALKSGKPANIIAHSRESRESGITHKRIAPREFVVSAGVLALHYAHIRNLFTTTIYLDIDEQELTRRRLARGEHDIGPWNELPYIEGNLLPKHRALVVPQKAHAQYVLDATLPPDEVARQVIDILTAPA
jgi:uridine kinase